MSVVWPGGAKRKRDVAVIFSCMVVLLPLRGNTAIAQSNITSTSTNDDNNINSTSSESNGNTATPTSSPTASPSSASSECMGYALHIQDGYCDADLNNAACGYDGGDCCACTCLQDLDHECGEMGDGFDCRDPTVPADCNAGDLSNCDAVSSWSWQDGFCDSEMNNAECGYDGGDCCECTCRNYASTTWYDNDYCGYYGFDCQDPAAPTACEAMDSDAPTPSPTSYNDLLYPECEGITAFVGDNYCDPSLNNADCAWDGGDCCRCTCGVTSESSTTTYASYGYLCGVIGYDCLDPTATDDCPTLSPTPIPTYTYWTDDYYGGSEPTPSPTSAESLYPSCEGIHSYISDAECDTQNNNEECGWDGGDCCPCTCVDTPVSSCGGNGYACQDPTADGCDATSTTSSSTIEGQDRGIGEGETDDDSWALSSGLGVLGVFGITILGFCCFGAAVLGGLACVYRRCKHTDKDREPAVATTGTPGAAANMSDATEEKLEDEAQQLPS